MGLLRIILAMGVLLEHANDALFIGSYSAVQVFYMISGFYMTLIYGRKYTQPSSFYKSRFLRIYPAYWVTILFCIFYSLVADQFGLHNPIEYWRQSWPNFNLMDVIYFIYANLFIIGSDAIWFLPTAHYPGVQHPIHLLFVVPSWTISLELIFYLCFPFISRLRNRTLYITIALIILIRVFCYIVFDMNQPPWHARFIGFEFMFFLLGTVSGRFYLTHTSFWLDIWQQKRRFCIIYAVIYFAIITSFYPLISHLPALPYLYQMPTGWPSVIVYLMTIPLLPLLFTVCKNNRWDRRIGEWSYPVYLIHYMFVIFIVHNNLMATSPHLRTWLIVGLTLGHTWLIYYFTQIPIDRYRLRFAERQTI